VNEFVYCPRLAYLMWSQAEWAETGDTVDGKRVHNRVDRPNAPLPDPETLDDEEGKVVSRSLTLSSETLGVIAKIDIAEAEVHRPKNLTRVYHRHSARTNLSQSGTRSRLRWVPLRETQTPSG